MITAETFPSCERSTRTRCLRLVLNEPVPNHLLLSFQERPELLGNAFQSFIMRTAGNFEKITQQIAEDFQEYRKGRAQPGAPSVASERLYEIGFVLYTALKVYFSQKYGPDSPKTGEKLTDFQKRLNSWIDWQLSPQAAPGRGWLISAIAALSKQCPREFYWRQDDICIPTKRLCQLLQTCYRGRRIKREDIIEQLKSEELLFMAARLLGHSDLKMLTKIYDHTSEEILRNALLGANSSSMPPKK